MMKYTGIPVQKGVPLVNNMAPLPEKRWSLTSQVRKCSHCDTAPEESWHILPPENGGKGIVEGYQGCLCRIDDGRNF